MTQQQHFLTHVHNATTSGTRSSAELGGSTDETAAVTFPDAILMGSGTSSSQDGKVPEYRSVAVHNKVSHVHTQHSM